jgi:hypothetical protein
MSREPRIHCGTWVYEMSGWLTRETRISGVHLLLTEIQLRGRLEINALRLPRFVVEIPAPQIFHRLAREVLATPSQKYFEKIIGVKLTLT